MKQKFLKVMILVCIILGVVGVTFAGNFYTAEKQLMLNDIYNETIFAAGEKVDISGFVEGIGFVAAEDIRLTGNLEYAAFAGNNIRVKGSVTKEAFLAGNQIFVDEGANIGRNAYIAGREVTISGNVEGSLFVAAEKVVFENATISGDVSVGAARLYVDDTTIINGMLTYQEDCQTNFTSLKNVGEIKIVKNYRVEPTQEDWMELRVMTVGFSILTMLVTFLILYLINPNFFNGSKYIASKSFGYFFLEILKGLAEFIVIPIVCFVLLFTVVGIPIAFLLLVFYILLLFVAKIFFSVYLAELVVSKVDGMKNSKGRVVLWSMVMIAVLKLVEMIPIVGPFVSVFSFLIGLGIAVDCVIYRSPKENKLQEMDVERTLTKSGNGEKVEETKQKEEKEEKKEIDLEEKLPKEEEPEEKEE